MCYRLPHSIVLVLTLLVAHPIFSAVPPTPAQVEASLKKAREWLYAKQQGDNWEAGPPIDPKEPKWIYSARGAQYGGRTALAVYALLASGSTPQESKIASAIEWLKKVQMKGIYATGVRCQVWLMIPQTSDVKKKIQEDFRTLLDAMHKKGPWAGQFYYTKTDEPDQGDHSVSQYGVLGAWACERAGLEVPLGFWRSVEAGWTKMQQPDGGWCYGLKPQSNRPVNHQMTAAGVATLFITQDYLHTDAGVRCTGNIKNDALDKGMEWMRKNFSTLPAEPYGLYGIERIGVASGYKYFDTFNWFEEGASKLIKTQQDDGHWEAADGGDIAGTCFATLFLSRGRAPVVMNKLEYDKADGDKRVDANWNERPRDVANLTHWIAKQNERDLNWQIVNLKVSVDDLHDAPILYISGNQPLSFLPEEEAKLRQFVQQGGIIFGHADCGSDNFSKSFRELGTKLFPTYEFRELPKEHPIYTNEQFMRSKWKSPPSVLSLSNGVRELMLLIPTADPGKAWQLQDDRAKEELYQFGANLFLYSIDKANLRFKGETYLVKPDTKVQTERTINVARLQHDANWDPEPGGWTRLSAVMKNENKVDLKTTPVKLDAGALKDFKIAHLTGTAKISLSANARDELKRFLKDGGTLIVDAAGGSTEFSESVERELEQLIPEQSAGLKQPLPTNASIYSTIKPEEIGYRAFAKRTLGSVRRPQIRGMKLNDRLAILYSREDISGGLVGQPVDGIVGYDPKSATSLMQSMLLTTAGEKSDGK